MTDLVIDDTLLFRFSAEWLALDWDTRELSRVGRAGTGKAADIVAMGPLALIVEVKDDRNKTTSDRHARRKDAESGAFLEEMAEKLRTTLGVILEVAPTEPKHPFYERFPRQWDSGPHLMLLWWDWGRDPPSGPGTHDERLKKTLSAFANVLKTHLRGVTNRVKIASLSFDWKVVDGMRVFNVAPGVGKRRTDVLRKETTAQRPGKMKGKRTRK